MIGFEKTIERRKNDVLKKHEELVKLYQKEVKNEFLEGNDLTIGINDNDISLEESCTLIGILFKEGLNETIEYIENKQQKELAIDKFYSDLGDAIVKHQKKIEEEVEKLKSTTIEIIKKSDLFLDLFFNTDKTSKKDRKPLLQ